jgi:hypothetical protein
VQSTAQHQRLPAVYHTNPVIHAFRLFTCAQGCEQACAEVGAWGLQGMKQGGGGLGASEQHPRTMVHSSGSSADSARTVHHTKLLLLPQLERGGGG